MANFELITNGIDVGYGEDGFFAMGVSTAHRFGDDEDWEGGRPPVRGMPVCWSISLSGKDPFEEYVSYTYPPSELSPRVALLRDLFSETKSRPVGKMRRWDHNEPIQLSYYFPNDASLAALIVGAVAADRELTIRGSGWYFLTDDSRLAPAPTVDGFMERKEPAFATELPTLRVRR